MKDVVFSLPSEALGTASSAVLLGDFNNWDIDRAIALKPHKDGTLKATIKLQPGQTYEYRFLLNDGRWVNDWAAQGYVHKHHFGIDNSVITVEEEMVVVKKAAAKVAGKTARTVSKAAKKAAEMVKNDLTKIEGIGPAIAKLLEQEGIHNFKDLSKATIKKLKAVLDAAGSKFAPHDPKSWPKQAKLAAAEKWEDLKALQQELLGGK
ncbi:helix-hairpin-helix domain-containing protein [Niabella beijingensis]|uniref:helix-hairpin-helix domain-containing protein n=1 Tax=Niabella beijingensis TaxID=2872700 RepID=UPI001CBDA757|nr:helix-hairpin-helix domain-containing protein [Niabella beijingensis]MBZ4188740.1 glycoside hydrolase family 13 [Niabella beijingensis]